MKGWLRAAASALAGTRSNWGRWLASLCVWLGFATSIAVAAPAPLLSQYEHSAWPGHDGSIKNPADIGQTRDGALWIGTNTGLLRFDGVRFVPHNQFGGVSIAEWHIGVVLGARDGSLWLGAIGHVGHVVDGQLREYAVAGGVDAIKEGGGGVVWLTLSPIVGPQAAPLCSVSNDRLRCIGKPIIPYAILGPLSIDADGSLWMGSDEGVCHWSPHWPSGRPADCALHQMLGPTYGLTGVADMLRSRKDGALWLGIAEEGHPYGLGRLVEGQWAPLVTSTLDGRKLDVNELMEDADGTLWVGTHGSGIYRVQAGRVDHFDKQDGLTDNAIYNLFEDSEGTVWAVTASGLDAFRKLPISVFSVREGLPSNEVSAVQPSRDGGIWVSSHPLARLQDDHVSPQVLPALLRNKTAKALLEDHQGRLWVGVDGDLVVLEAGVLHRITDAKGHPTGAVHMLVEDAARQVWAMTLDPEKGPLRIRNFVYEELRYTLVPRIIVPDPAGGLWMAFADSSFGRFRGEQGEAATIDRIDSRRVRSLRAEADGTLFVAADEGLLIKRGGRRRWLDVDHGLPCATVLSVVRDTNQSAWLLLDCGILQITAADLEAWLAHPEGRIRSRLLDASDGFQPGASGSLPRAALAPDGRLWFGTDKIVQVIDPAAPRTLRKPVPVQIDEFLADRKAYRPGAALTLPPHTRDIEIRYAAFSYVLPRKIRFRYRLDGRDKGDKDWTDADSRREVFYSDLPPGAYRFRVIACNSDGVWNETDASVAFEIQPAFYQTGSFLALCIALGAALPYLAYLARVRQLARRYQDRLAAQNDERERIARDLHDTLLQGTQGLVLSFQAVAMEYPESDPRRQRIEALLDHADQVIAQTRDEVHSLRTSAPGPGDPGDAGNLFERLALVGDELARAFGGTAAFTPRLQGGEQVLKPVIADEIFPLIREALLNAFRHARARQVVLVLVAEPAGLRIEVKDDGIGLDRQIVADSGRPGHWGLAGMRERALRIGATLATRSEPGAGTEIALQVPASVAYAAQARRPGLFRKGWAGGSASAIS